MFYLVSVFLEHSFPASAFLAKGSGYGLLHAHWWFGFLPPGSPLVLQVNIEGGDCQEILLKLVKKAPTGQCQTGFRLPSQVVWGADCPWSCNLRVANSSLWNSRWLFWEWGFSLEGMTDVKSTFWIYSSTLRKDYITNFLNWKLILKEYLWSCLSQLCMHMFVYK